MGIVKSFKKKGSKKKPQRTAKENKLAKRVKKNKKNEKLIINE
jgi:hypothetical protein